jgi:hypothetical protein
MKTVTLDKSSAKEKFLPVIEPLLWFALLFLYTYTAYTSFGYDDEYFNIRIVTENNLKGMIHLTQTSDLHPPLSYIINYILYQISGNWSLVRVASALFFLSTLYFTSRKIEDIFPRLLTIVLLGLNPTVLLWATGLRWYAYMLPLLLIWSDLPRNYKWYYWPKFFLLLFIVCYTGYAGFFLAVPYFIYYWLSDKRPFLDKLKSIFIPGFVFAAAYAWQLYIFFTVHSKINLNDDSNKQVFNLKTSLSSLLSSAASNQGVFPVSWSGLCSILGAVMVYTAMAMHFKKTWQQKQFILFFGTGFLFVLTGIAGKVRNLVLLEPARAQLFASAIASGKKWVLGGFFLVLIGNGAGIYHVVSHQQTTKNAWNIPVTKVLAELDKIENSGNQEIYFTYHPSFTFYLLQSKKRLISFYNTLYFDSTRIPFTFNQLITEQASLKKNYTFILTYAGQSIADTVHRRMLAAMNTVIADSISHLRIGRDDDFRLKQRFFPGFPEYAVEIVKYYGVRSFDTSRLSVWDKGR